MGKKSSPKTLWEALKRVRDHRSRQGRRYELQSLLGLAVGAALGGCSSLSAIAQWVEEVSKKGLLHLFGIERRGTPCHATFHYVFTALDVRSLERALGRWVRSILGGEELGHVAIDGKELRGSKHGEYPGLRLIAAYCEKLKGVVAELRLPEGTNEIGAAYKLLKEIPLEGTIVTGDAIYAQKRLCRKIVEGGGDYFFAVKENQPGLLSDIKTAFDEPFSPLRREAASA